MSDQVITLTRVYDPLNHASKDSVQWQYHPGATVADLLDNTGAIITERESVRFAVSINGVQVPVDQYAETRLVPGQQVVVVPYLHGGSTDSKNVLRTVGLVVLAVISTIVSVFVPALWPVTGFLWKMAFMSAYMTIGMAIYGALGGYDHGQQSAIDNGYQGNSQSQSYSWNPQTTQQQGIPIPWRYGISRITGNIIGVYRENIGTQQYINALISLGEGPVSAPYDIKINGQPMENYTGITLHTRLGYLDQEPVPNFGDTITEYPQGTKVVYGAPVTYTTIGADFDTLDITVGFPNGLYYFDTYGNMAALGVQFSIEVRKQGDVDWTHIATSPGTIKVSDGGYWSIGGWTEIWHDGYFNEASTMWVDGWYETVWSEVRNGGTDPNAHYEGEQYQLNIVIFGEWNLATYRWIGDPIRIADIINPYTVVSGAQTGTLQYTCRANGLEVGKYEVRITRLTAEYTDTRYGDDFYLLAVQEVVLDDFTYPGEALVGLRALATDQLSGSFSFECKTAGKLCRVYDGSAWSVVATSNPAWVCFDILTQPIFDNDLTVLGYRAYDPAGLDLDRWVEWAEYCDDLVPDGSGGTEARLTYNGSFDSSVNMWDAALAVAKIGRAVPYWRGQTITVAIDKPSDPVALITVGNIGLDSFEETFLPLEDRAGSIEADFLNLEKNLDRDKLTIINPDAPVGWGNASLQLQGVIRPSEIWRHCRYYLATTQNMLRVVTVQMDIDSIAFTLGDVINVQHDVPMCGAGGRIVSATSTTVTLDKEVTLLAGTNYSIMLRLLDNTLVERVIADVPGAYTTLTITVPFAVVPDPFDPYAVGPVDTLVKPMRVTDIDSAGDLKRKITLTDYNETLWNTDTLEPVVPTINYSTPALPNVTGLLLAERLVKKVSGLIITILDITWTPPTNSPAVRAVEVFVNNKSLGLFGAAISSTTAEVTDGATAYVAVRTIGWDSRQQDLAVATRASLYIVGKTARPADVTGLAATTTTSGALRLDWLPVADVDIDHYEVRYNTGSAAWESSQFVANAYTSTITLPAAQDGKYMIKAVDTSNLYSLNAASVVVAMPGLSSFHLQQDIAEETAFSGTKTGCSVTSGKLDLDLSTWDGTSAVGYYQSATTIDLGSVQVVRCLCSVDFTGIDTQTVWDSIVDLDAVPNIDAIGSTGNAEGCEVRPEISLSQDGSSFGSWQAFSIGDYSARAFRFRLVITSTVQTSYVQVSALHFKLYLPYRSQLMPGVALAASPATTIAFTPVFVAEPLVRATIRNAQSGDTAQITGISTTQFTIQVLNGGTGVARTVDIEALGY